jgi:tetratricopeptide (TPR) repeat protein
MKTLYDLLGALPNDDAEGLRTAFRNAVKGSHPDICPGDPDAGLKFRQIVRANEILRDPDQRAAYDHLMDLALVEQRAVSTQVIATRIYKLAFGLVGLAGGSVATVGVYLLLLHLSAGSLAPQNEFDTAARGQVEMAALAHAAFREASETKVAAAKDDAAAAAPDAITQHVVTTETITENTPATIVNTGDADASEVLRARGITAYRNGDLDGAMADLDQAIQLNPKFAAAYIDRGIVLYRMQKFDRALADVARAKQIEGKHSDKPADKPTRAKPEPAAAGKPDSVVVKRQRSAQAANALALTQVSQRRGAGPDASREEGATFLRVR